MSVALMFIAAAALAAEAAHRTRFERRDIAILSTQAAIVLAVAAVTIVLVMWLEA